MPTATLEALLLWVRAVCALPDGDRPHTFIGVGAGGHVIAWHEPPGTGPEPLAPANPAAEPVQALTDKLGKIKAAIVAVLQAATAPIKARTIAAKTRHYGYNTYFSTALKSLKDSEEVIELGRKYWLASRPLPRQPPARYRSGDNHHDVQER
jgi:hypothetical protein